tara:strand:- start:2675 stop:3442 length:768 start_codon:yes stop_codon:yes gene_type:complete
MAAFTAIAGATIALGSAVSSGIAAGKSRRAARRKEAGLRNLEANRQEIINPYENVKDLSGMINNPFANLQVATQAAEMQAEEADISLASTLDTLRATGAGSAGATALAQAALRSKQGISATIEQQEAQNSRLRAQGEAQAQSRRMSEMQRLQQADISGRQFMFGAREQREMQQLNRLAGLAQGNRAAAASQQGAMYGALGSLGGQLMGMDFGGRTPQVNTVNSITPSRNIVPVSTSNLGSTGSNADISAPIFGVN